MRRIETSRSDFPLRSVLALAVCLSFGLTIPLQAQGEVSKEDLKKAEKQLRAAETPAEVRAATAVLLGYARDAEAQKDLKIDLRLSRGLSKTNLAFKTHRRDRAHEPARCTQGAGADHPLVQAGREETPAGAPARL